MPILDPQDIRTLRLDSFSGPFDLLLALVRKRQVDVLDIPIATITSDYLRCLDVMSELSIEISGDFLSMASTLTYLKSKRLLPELPSDDEDDDPERITTEEELFARLAELARLQRAASQLWERDVLGRDTFVRPPFTPQDLPARAVFGAPVIELAQAFFGLVKDRTPGYLRERLQVGMSLGDAMRRILTRLSRRKRHRFGDLLHAREGRGDAVALFLSILELARWNLIHIAQDVLAGEALEIRFARSATPEELETLLASHAS